MMSKKYMNAAGIVIFALLAVLFFPGYGVAYNKSWDQGHKCVNTLPGASGWGRYGYDTTSPNDYRGGNYSSEDCCEEYCKLCPVYANTGRLQKTFSDLTIPGVGPTLSVTRTYLSQDWANTLFGRGWIFNFGKKLIVTRDGNGEKIVVVRRKMGEENFFKEHPDGTIEPLAYYGLPYDLIKNGDGTYTITNKNGSVQLLDTDGKTVNITDKNGNKLLFIYDSVGCLSRITNASGNYVDFVKGANGKVASISDNFGRSVKYTYDTDSNLISVTDSMDNVTQYSYDSQNRMVSITDPRGYTVLSVTYDSFQPSRIATLTEKGETWTFTYYDGYTVKRDSSGNTWTSYYNDVGIIEKVIDPLGNETKQSHNYATSTSMEWEEDANGNRTTYTYDEDGNIATKTDPIGNIWQYNYLAGTDQLEMETNPLGLMIKYEYDTDGNLIKLIRDFGGALENTTVYTYDTSGNQTSVTDPMGNTTQYEYNSNGNLMKITYALGNVTAYTYDSRGNKINETDGLGNTTTFTYDPMDRLLTKTDALGNTTTYSYDSNGNQTSVTDANGNTTQFVYDAYNRLIQVIDALGNTTSYTYDYRDNRTSITNGNGNTTTYTYDILDRLIRETNALGQQINYTYDAAGNVLTLTDDCGNTTTYTYDVANRKISETNAAGETTTSTYDVIGNLLTNTYPNGYAISRTYDSLGRLVALSDSLGALCSYTYDLTNRQLTETDALGNIWAKAYDTLGRTVQVTDPLGNTIAYAYDVVGRLLTTTDREGNTTGYTYDAVGRRISATDPLGNTTTYSYDSIGNLSSITDALGNTTNYSYDTVNRLIQETYDDGTTRSFAYDAVGNRISRTDQKGQVTSYTYDAVNRTTTVDYPGTNDNTYSYDCAGSLLTANNVDAGVSLAYDNAYRLTQSTQNGQTVAYSYDTAARTKIITYPGGRIVKEFRDVRWQLIRLEDASAQSIIQYAYDGASRPQTKTYANGVVASFTHNANAWITQLTYDRGGSQILGLQYGFDKEGNRLNARKLHDTGNSEQYLYDAKYRLVQFKRGTLDGSGVVTVPVTQTAYNLDTLGNWTSKITDGVTENRTHNNMNELVSIDGSPLTYDDNGNLTDDGTNTYEYDYENRLVRATRTSDSAVLGEYEYDALGRRVEKQISGTIISYYYDGDRIIEERVGGTTEATYAYGMALDEVVCMERSGQTYYYHTDSLVNIIAVIDASGAIVEQHDYEAYGNPTPSTSAPGNPYMFTGRQLDHESGLQYNRNRYLSHVLGRWTTRDPRGYINGMNLYEYAGSNPINRIDPYGLTYSESVTNDTRQNIMNTYGVYAYTGSSTSASVATPQIVTTTQHKIKDTGCCATVESAQEVAVNVLTVLPNDAVGVIYTQNGFVAVQGHESRRRQAYRAAHNAYIDPISVTGSRATRCGRICRQTPGKAKQELLKYLNDNQSLGIQRFNQWVLPQQIAIGGESQTWIYSNGLRDQIGTIYQVPQPPALPDIPCPAPR